MRLAKVNFHAKYVKAPVERSTNIFACIAVVVVIIVVVAVIAALAPELHAVTSPSVTDEAATNSTKIKEQTSTSSPIEPSVIAIETDEYRIELLSHEKFNVSAALDRVKREAKDVRLIDHRLLLQRDVFRAFKDNLLKTFESLNSDGLNVLTGAYFNVPDLIKDPKNKEISFKDQHTRKIKPAEFVESWCQPRIEQALEDYKKEYDPISQKAYNNFAFVLIRLTKNKLCFELQRYNQSDYTEVVPAYYSENELPRVTKTDRIYGWNGKNVKLHVLSHKLSFNGHRKYLERTNKNAIPADELTDVINMGNFPWYKQLEKPKPKEGLFFWTGAHINMTSMGRLLNSKLCCGDGKETVSVSSVRFKLCSESKDYVMNYVSGGSTDARILPVAIKVFMDPKTIVPQSCICLVKDELTLPGTTYYHVAYATPWHY